MRLILSALVALAACGPATPEQPASETIVPQATEPAAPVPAPTAPPAAIDTRTPETMLEPIASEDEASLKPGAGCAFIADGETLMMARLGDGIVKFGGAVRRVSGLPSDFDALARGGSFAAGDLQLRIAPAAVLRPEEGAIVRAATLEGLTANVSRQYVGEWNCAE